MRLLALLPLLAATALAADAEPSLSAETTSSEASASPASSSEAASASSTEEPTPVGQLWSAQWDESDLSSYEKKCANTVTHKAQVYTLGEMYPALKEWAPELKVFYHRQHYPGSWAGEDVHGDGRALLKMGFAELPSAVREWLTRNPKQRHYSVQDDVVFFAPGAIYPILPLWVGEPDTKLGECEGLFEDLENYSPKPSEGVVLGSLSHEKKGKNEVELTFEAFQVKQKNERDEL